MRPSAKISRGRRIPYKLNCTRCVRELAAAPPTRTAMPKMRTALISLLILTATLAHAQSPDWRSRLREELPLLGHRNWIAIVDSAYPLQTSTGIETIETNSDHLDVIKEVFVQLGKVKHVRPVIFTDAELKAVPETDAAGVTAYREALAKLLSTSEPQSLPHEEIIAKLDEAGKTFHILVLKTDLTIPYTSVFIRLDCGYWTSDQEKRLRSRMAKP